jgi:hypothetical protein
MNNLKDNKINVLQSLDVFLKPKKNKIIVFSILSILIFWYAYDIGMFWDNVLFVSQSGNYLYNHSIFNWFVPNSLDAGHPPTLGFLSAIFWKIFGHHLWVSHLLMIPFTIGFFYQLFKFILFYTKSNVVSVFGFLLIIVDPTLSTQLVLVNPEIILLFFFFLAINSILNKQIYMKIIALFFLSILSLRSMMLCGGIFLFEVLNQIYINKKKIKSFFSIKFILSYLIGSLPAVLYLVWHYINKGWLFSFPESTWADHRHFVSLKGFFVNVIYMLHRYSDFGRLFIYLFLIFCIIKFKKKLFNNEIKQLVLLTLTSVLILMIVSLMSTNPFAHRYFIASYIVLNFLSFLILIKFFRRKQLVYTLLFLLLVTGNLWIYPREISQGWDASLAHLPYYKLRTKAIAFLDKNKININDVATFFPNLTTIDNIDLNNDLRTFSAFNGKNKYIFFSNVFNLSDHEYEKIDNDYIIIKQLRKNSIYIYIYKLKEHDSIRR